MITRPRVIIESPFRAKRGRDPAPEHLVYLRRVLRDSWERGEDPFASHAYYPFFLDESNPREREEGILSGYLWWPFASLVVFYIDYGMSPGMEAALDRAVHRHIETRVREIGVNP